MHSRLWTVSVRYLSLAGRALSIAVCEMYGTGDAFNNEILIAGAASVAVTVYAPLDHIL